MNVSAVSFDAKSGNYMAKVGSKTIKSYSKAYVERRVKSMVGDVETAVGCHWCSAICCNYWRRWTR